jgi:hypothetical protein
MCDLYPRPDDAGSKIGGFADPFDLNQSPGMQWKGSPPRFHIDGFPAILDEQVAMWKIVVGDDAAQANGISAICFLGFQPAHLTDASEDGQVRLCRGRLSSTD